MKTLASAQPFSFVLVVVTIGYTFFYIVKNVSIVANIGTETAARWGAPPSTQRITPASRGTGWGKVSALEFFHLPRFSNTRETVLHYVWNESIKNDDRGTWIKLPDGGKAYLQDSLLIMLNVSDGSTVTHRRELLFFCPLMQVYWWWQHIAIPCGWWLFETWKEGVKRPGKFEF